MEQKRSCWGLLRRRQCLVPTWRGWLLLLLTFAGLLFVGARTIHPFLAVTRPVTGGVLVVEGWAPDWALQAAITEFQRNHYEKMFVTGIPLEQGAPLSEYKTYAELGTATLLKLGLNSNVVQAVPTPAVIRDRTYASAVTLKRWWREHGMAPTRVNVITEGPHARRSRLLFQKALGNNVRVGIVALQSDSYDPKHWWRSSQGVRTVIGETLAYGYARILFRAPNEEGP